MTILPELSPSRRTPWVPACDAANEFSIPVTTDGTTDSGIGTTCSSSGNDNFYTWTATSTGLTFNDGTGAPGIRVFANAGTTAAPALGTEFDCTNTFAPVDASLQGWAIGDDLIIQVYDFAGSTSDLTFCLNEFTPPPAPVNNLCADATVIDCTTTALMGTTIGATDTGEPDVCLSQSEGVWYLFAGTGQDVTVEVVAGAGFDPELSVSSGSCGAFTIATACVDDSGLAGTETITFSTESGTDYYVYVADWSGSTTNTNAGDFTLSVTACVLPLSFDCEPNRFLDVDMPNGTTATLPDFTDSINLVGGTAVQTPAPGSTISLGSNTVTIALTGTDLGEMEDCAFDVFVSDPNGMAMAVCADVTINLDEDGNASLDELVQGPTLTEINGTLATTDPQFTRPFSISPGNCNPSGAGTSVYYQFFQFTVDATGSYTFEGQDIAGGVNSYYALYDGAFDPTDPCLNNLDDDNTSGPGSQPSITQTLTAGGTYFLVVTTSANNNTGAFQTFLTGAGNVISGSSAGPADDALDGGSTGPAPLTFSASQLDFDCSDLGDNNVTLTVTASNGTTDMCTSVVNGC